MNTLDYLNKYYKDLEKEQHIKYIPLLNRIWCAKDKQSYKELTEFLSVSIRYHYDLNSFHRLSHTYIVQQIAILTNVIIVILFYLINIVIKQILLIFCDMQENNLLCMPCTVRLITPVLV